MFVCMHMYTCMYVCMYVYTDLSFKTWFFSRKGKTAKLIASGHGEWNYLDIVAFGAGSCQVNERN